MSFFVVSDLFGSVRGCPFVLYLTCLVVFVVVLFCCVSTVRYSQWFSFLIGSDLFGSVLVCPFLLCLTCLVVFVVVLLFCV